MDSLNQALFLALNASDAPFTPVVVLAIVAAKYLILLVPLHILLLGIWGTRTMRLIAMTAFLALLIAVTINGVIGLFAYTPRPFILGIGHTLIDHRDSSSFPSNHGTVMFTYAMTLGLFGIWRLCLSAAILGLLVAWSRIYLGVHFPLDMVGALPIGALAAFAAHQIMLHQGHLWLRRLEHLMMRASGFAEKRVGIRLP